ncbi:hypothetical protein [Pseudogemmobacter sonorensis]|uniref:hypothetical protein n=1 Tax=Pseudogemmobacter sonorensis TaxID=2989681 RepID=UPI00367D520E
MLQTLRSHDQYNTTIDAMGDRYRGVCGEREVVFVNPDDLAGLRAEVGARLSQITQARDGRGPARQRLSRGAL